LEEKIALEIRETEKKFADQRNTVLRERNEVIRAIPNFWKKTLENHDVLASYLTPSDLDIFDYVVDLFVEELYDNMDAFKVILTFKDGNPYFSNKSIFKAFRFNKEKDAFDIEATKIQWKEGKNLAQQNKDIETNVEKANADATVEDEDFQFHWFGHWETEDGDDEVSEYIREDIWEVPGKIYRASIADQREDFSKE